MDISREDWPLLLNLAEKATELPSAERHAWMESLDLSKALAEALQTLLHNRSAIESEDFLNPPHPVVQMESLFGQGRLREGALIGSWRLLREIGQGGMAKVWLAERADQEVELRVALKLPHAGPGHDLLARGILRERKILAALEHRHIARLYDVGIASEGSPYLAMEYVRGANLLVHADDKRLGVRDRLFLFLQVLAAVQYAHGKLVLHRDLKPSNMLVDTDGQIKLLDFGIAKFMSGDGTTGERSELTRGIERKFTPSYASPEQIQGRPLGTASDVYSLGVVLYELLCGIRPHADAGASASQVEAAVLNDEILPPSRCESDTAKLMARSTTARDQTKILRGDLDAIVLKALAKAPEHRYLTAEAFGADLCHWLNGETICARRPSFWYPVGKFVKRNAISVGLGAVAVSAVLAAGTVAIFQARIAIQEGERAAAARDFMLHLFEESAPAKLHGVELTTSQRLELGRKQVEVRLKGQTRLQAEFLFGIGEAQLKAGDTASAEAALQKAANLFRMTGERLREAAARVLLLGIAVDDGDLTVATSLIHDLEPLLPVIRSEPALHLRLLAVQGTYALRTDDLTTARKRLEECVAMADLEDSQQIATAFKARLVLAEVLLSIDEPRSAIEQLNSAEKMPESSKSLSEVEREMALTETRALLFWLSSGSSTIEKLQASGQRCDVELGPRHLICVRLKILLVTALRTAGEIDRIAPLIADGSWWIQRSSSPTVQYWAAVRLAQATALKPEFNPKAEPILVLEELLATDAKRPLPAKLQLEGLITLAEIRLRLFDRRGASTLLDRAELMLARSGTERERALLHAKLGRGLIMQSLGEDSEALLFMSDLCQSPISRSVRYSLMRMNCVRSLALTGQTVDAIRIASETLQDLNKTIGPQATNTLRVRTILEALQSRGGWRPLPWDSSQIFLAF